MQIAIHELSHAIVSARSGLLVRLDADTWEFRPSAPPEGVNVVLAQLAGIVGERTTLGLEAQHMLDMDPAGFFHTACASDEDLVLVDYDVTSCANMVREHQLIERLSFALNELGTHRIKVFARSMEAVQIGDALKLEGLPPLPPVRTVH